MATSVHLFLPLAPTGTYSEAHPYGPEPRGIGFFPGIGIDIQGAARPNCRAVAVVGGIVRLLSNDTLVLFPRIGDHITNVGASLGASVCFVYRNLDLSDVVPLKTLLARQKHPEKGTTLEQRWASFVRGESFIWVDGGTQLVLPQVNASGVGLLEFEIVFVLGGASFDLTLAETRRLIDPANKRRRYDPASFYKVIEADDRFALAPADVGSSLLDAFSKRVLLELRDEYDRPYDNVSVVVSDDRTNTQRTRMFTASQWGHCDIGVPTPDRETDYTISRDHHAFTRLPSGAANATTEGLAAPAHWSLQSIFMADVDDPLNWFASNASPVLPRYRSRNRIKALVDGTATFKAMVAAMRSVHDPRHYLLLTAWWLSSRFELEDNDPEKTFKRLAEVMAANGASIYALIWKQTFGSDGRTETDQSVADINALRKAPIQLGFAVADGQHPLAGAHHQKAIILDGADGPRGFLGGVDLNPDRLDDPAHRAASPFHDVHCTVAGSSVLDLYTNFVQRWNRHPEVVAGRLRPITEPAPNVVDPDDGTHYAQVTRTFAAKGGKYPFAPDGEYGSLKALLAAIAHARRYIYIEEQYLVAYPHHPDDRFDDRMGLLTALRAALARIEFLIIVIPNHTTLPQDRFRRKVFIDKLKEVGGDRVKVYYLDRTNRKNRKDANSVPTGALDAEANSERLLFTEGDSSVMSGNDSASGGKKYPDEIYVHSKVWIIDDVYVKIGSSNINRRGFTHDSEIDIHVIDHAVINGRRKFAFDLRQRLWTEHLGDLPPEDPTAAFEFWKRNSDPESAVVEYQQDKEVQKIHTPISWNNACDPDGSDPNKPVP